MTSWLSFHPGCLDILAVFMTSWICSYVPIVYNCYYSIYEVETGESVDGTKFGTRTTSGQLQRSTDFASNRSQFPSDLWTCDMDGILINFNLDYWKLLQPGKNKWKRYSHFGLTQLFDIENICIFSSELLCSISQAEELYLHSTCLLPFKLWFIWVHKIRDLGSNDSICVTVKTIYLRICI
jgi:hypothetical protein